MPFDQGWHRDSYWGVQRVRHHRPRWLLCMYYPAAVTLEMGPTAIAPGSQYYSLPADGDGSARTPAQPIRHDRIDDTRERAHVAAERSPRAAHARQSRGGRRCAPSGSSRRLQVISQRLGRLIEVDEQEAGPTLQPQRYQSVVRGVEVGGLLHPAHTDEVAVGAIGPCVVGADDGGTVPFARQETTPRCRHVLAKAWMLPDRSRMRMNDSPNISIVK